MTVVIPINFVEYSFEMRNDNDPDPWYTTIGANWTVTDGWTEIDALQAAYGAFSAAWEDKMSTQVTFSGVYGKFGQDGDPLTLFVPGSTVGHNGADILPQNCSLLISKQTTLGGRKGKGRMFMPGVLESDHVTQTGNLDNDALGELADAAGTFLTYFTSGVPGGDFPDSGQAAMLLHNDYGPSTPDPTPVLGLVVQREISTQRRRLR